MTIFEFLALDDREQAEMMWYGVLLGEREDYEHNVLLYQIDAFYVEAYYHKRNKAMDRLIPFTSTDLLTTYLEKIDISDL